MLTGSTEHHFTAFYGLTGAFRESINKAVYIIDTLDAVIVGYAVVPISDLDAGYTTVTLIYSGIPDNTTVRQIYNCTPDIQ